MSGTLQVGGVTLATHTESPSTLTLDSGVVFPAGGTGNAISVAVIVDEKPSGTSSGDFTSGDWRDRDLNTEISDPDSIVSISSNQFTLGAGTYFIEWSCPAYRVNGHKSRLYDVTGTSALAIGSTALTDPNDATTNTSIGSFLHTITGNNIYKIQHQASSTKTSNGLGTVSGFSTVEIYTIVKITKLK